MRTQRPRTSDAPRFVPIFAANRCGRATVLNPFHERLEQLDRLWTIAPPAMSNTGRKIEAQKIVGLALAQRATDRLDVVHASSNGDDVIRDSVPDDRFAAALLAPALV
jgi:hypothetical protein